MVSTLCSFMISICKHFMCWIFMWDGNRKTLEVRRLNFPPQGECSCHSVSNWWQNIFRLKISKWLLKYLSNYNLCYLKPDLQSWVQTQQNCHSTKKWNIIAAWSLSKVLCCTLQCNSVTPASYWLGLGNCFNRLQLY